MSEPTGPVLIRSEGLQIAAINFPKRIIELVVAPYEEKATVHDRGPRPVVEMFCRGAFDGIQRRTARIPKLNRDHDFTRTCGKVVALHPSRQEGLVAEVQMSKIGLGEESLILADEGMLGASAGFKSMPDGEEWNRDRTEVKIRKAWLHHVALVPDPAYDSAEVLSVRQNANGERTEPSGDTPNLATYRSWVMADEFEKLSRNV